MADKLTVERVPLASLVEASVAAGRLLRLAGRNKDRGKSAAVVKVGEIGGL